MTTEEYIATVSPERKEFISRLRSIILDKDKTVTETVQDTMGRPMLVYHNKGAFKYALANPKGHISLHNMVIYGNPALREKYMALLPNAKFLKGCINFTNLEDFPFNVINSLMEDCAKCNYPIDPSQYYKKK